jgi:hypothetical protein
MRRLTGNRLEAYSTLLSGTSSDIPGSASLLMMNNRPDRCRPVASELFVLEKRKLHSPAAEKVTGLEGVRKAETAP